MANLSIKQLEPGDIQQIAVINGGTAWNANPDLWDQYLLQQRKKERLTLLTAFNQQIVAYGSLVWLSDYGSFSANGIPEINNLVVAQQARGRGIATSLIAHNSNKQLDMPARR